MSSIIKEKTGTLFGWFNATQFLGALNDNIFKLLVILFLIKLQGTDKASSITAIAGAIFVLPFLIFMAAAGKFCGRNVEFGIVPLDAIGLTLSSVGLGFVPTIITIFLLPDFFVRFLAILLTRLCYRIKVYGIENVPTDKGALLISNHVSYVDALLLQATQQRRIRFVIEKRFYRKWWIQPLAKLMKVIPVSSHDSPRNIINSLRQARAAMDEGYLVCIFAEGMMTRSGMMVGFKAGFERILKGSSYNIIPVYLGGVWGSIFSYYGGRVLSMLPKRFPYPVSIHFGVPLPADSSTNLVRQKVAELSTDYYNSLKSPKRSLSHHFIKTARKNWSRRCISDTTGKQLNYGQTLIGSLLLSEKIKEYTQPGERIGIVLPPSAGAALANLAVTLGGRISVNLNFTAGQEAMNFAVRQCGIKYIISSRKFAEKAQVSLAGENIIFLEDIAGTISTQAKIKAFLKARFLPIRFLASPMKQGGDDLATILFSSGSSDRPKGVMLSHHNLISNIEATRMIVRIRSDDNLCGVLPFFHSFGFNCGFWLPIITGVSVSYIPNPLDGAAVGKSVRENRSTILFAPPTFFLNYIRRAGKEDFSSLRLAVAGAEKLKKSIADAFQEKFGIRPKEGYGATELSPVVSLNIPDIEVGGVHQVGTKEGSVGCPVPGVAVKIANPETNESLEAGKEGLLMVKSPNIMLGYLNDKEKTNQVIRDGWYNTGDIAKIDKDGFITITDRLSRFSKIGGEMVAHSVIEQVLNDAINSTEQLVAVTALPDEKKGEELIVFYLSQAGTVEKLYEIISKSSLPNICKPRRENFIEIQSMPTLGSGKIDFVKLKVIASELKKTKIIIIQLD